VSTFEVGDRVEPIYGGNITFGTGVVIGVNPDGTFTVRWRNGEIEKGCQPRLAVKVK
jgi:hypothetical protein